MIMRQIQNKRAILMNQETKIIFDNLRFLVLAILYDVLCYSYL